MTPRSDPERATERDGLLPRGLGDGDNDDDGVCHDNTLIPGFGWIEAALMANVFLAGFDGTVTAATYAVITSDFRGANLAVWLSTSYLVTSTALQPLYGRLSDSVGRRLCLLVATALFGLGCLGCGLTPGLGVLIGMRALAGAGGGGLMTMATILHTDLVPPAHRGLYQALQNTLHGLGAILGASLGGALADALGWRWCFLLQVPICAAALGIAARVVPGPPPRDPNDDGPSIWSQIDVTGAILLMAGLSLVLTALSLGSSTLPWTHPGVLGGLAAGIVLLAVFVAVEARTRAVPLLPLPLLHGTRRVALLVVHFALGAAGYGVLFCLPLFFQAVLLDSASAAGLRLVAASAATPVGGLVAGLVMRYGAIGPRGDLQTTIPLLLRLGTGLLFAGCVCSAALGMHDAAWQYAVYPMVGQLGLGVAYPSSLFGFLGACEPNEHAVATYLVYLVRSVGAVAGVAAIATLEQAVLGRELAAAFGDRPELVDTLTHSVEALRDLPPETRQLVQAIYYTACRTCLHFLLGIGLVAALASVLATRQRAPHVPK